MLTSFYISVTILLRIKGKVVRMMKMNRKGFTLIELLAIIVILAIIAVITVPIILNIIDNARKGAASNAIQIMENMIK